MTPVVHDRETIAFSGNDETAGILGFNDDGSLKIDASGRERYNSLIERFGGDTIPKTEKDFGCTPREDGNFDLTLEGAERWGELRQREKARRIDDADKLLNL